MARCSKLVSASSTRNIYAPRSDRCIGAWLAAETSGTTLANIGQNNTRQSAALNFGASASKVGSGSYSFVSAGTDPLFGPHITTAAGAGTGAAPMLYDNTGGGSPINVPRGTIILVVKPHSAADPGASEFWISSGFALNTDGHFSVQRLTNGNLQVRVRTSGANQDIVFTKTTEYSPTAWAVVVITWGERGYEVILNRYDDTVTAAGGRKTLAHTGGWQIAAGQGLRVANNATTTQYALHFSGAAFFDCQLRRKEIEKYLTDPWLIGRLAPSTTSELATNATALVSRMTTTSVNVNLVSGRGDTGDWSGVLSAANIGFRVKYGESRDPTSANHCNNTSSAVLTAANTDICRALNLVISGLSHSTVYSMIVEWTNDNGTTWRPMPGGLQRFTTQRTAEGVGKYAHISDPHGGALSLNFGADNYYQGLNLQSLAFEKAIDHIVNGVGDYDFAWLGGDWDNLDAVGVTGATLALRNENAFFNMFARAHNVRNFAHALLGDMGVFRTVGANHNCEQGYAQNCENGTRHAGMQALATQIRKSFYPGPTNTTYPQGGENEGDPASDGTLTWLPGNTGQYAAYSGGYAQYLSDYVHGPDVDFLNLNRSPLENYFAFEWGGGSNRVLLVALDNYRGVYPGDPREAIGASGSRIFAEPVWRPDAVQWDDWAKPLLLASDAPRKFVHYHNGPGTFIGVADNGGGTTCYGRDLGLRTEHDWFIEFKQVLRLARATAKVAEHDHKFGLGRTPGDTVNLITTGTVSAPSHAEGISTGWHFSEIVASYGRAESDGADITSYGDGEGTALGIVKMLNVLGYSQFSFESGQAWWRVVRTEIARNDAGAALGETPQHWERNVGQLVTAAADVATLSGVPRSVTEAYLASAIVRTGATPFWTTPPTSKKGTSVGDYPYDEDRASAAVTLASDVDNQDVYVMYAPQVMYEVSLENAVAPEGYQIFLAKGRSPDPESDPVIATAEANAQQLTLDIGALGLEADSNYVGAVVPFNAAGRGLPAAEFPLRTDGAGLLSLTPAPARNLRATVLSGGRVEVRWEYVEPNALALADDFVLALLYQEPDASVLTVNGPLRTPGKREYRHLLTGLEDGALLIRVWSRRETDMQTNVNGVLVQVDGTPPASVAMEMTAE